MGARLLDRWRADACVPPRFVPGIPYSLGPRAGATGSERHCHDQARSPYRPRLPHFDAAARVLERRNGGPETTRGDALPLGSGTWRAAPGAPSEGVAIPTDVTVLYVDFPDAVQRWDIEEGLTAGLVASKHAHVDEVISAHGGRLFPALLDARYALFDSVAATIAAAMAIAQGGDGSSFLAVSMGIASGPAPAGGYRHLRIVHQARAIA